MSSDVSLGSFRCAPIVSGISRPPCRSRLKAGLRKIKADPVAAQRAQNSLHIQSGLLFCAKVDAGATLVVMSACSRPQQEYMGEAIALSGIMWDRRQDHLVALAAANGNEISRNFRIQEVIGLKQERKYLDVVSGLLLSESAWKALQVSDCTSAARCLAFRMLSHGGAFAVVHLMELASKYPLTTYRLAFESMSTGDMTLMGRSLLEERRCLLDPWSVGLLDHYGPTVVSDEAVVDVVTRAMHLEVDNAMREAKHSAIRRHVMKASCQAHALGLEVASGRFIDNRLRHWESICDHPRRGRGGAQASGDGADEPLLKRPKRGGGGARRALFSAALKGVPKVDQDFSRLHEQWADLPDAEKDVYRGRGRAATLAHREGVERPFGLPQKEAERQLRREHRKAEEDRRMQLVRDRLSALANGDLADDEASHGVGSEALVPAGKTIASFCEAIAQASKVKALEEKAAAYEEDALALAFLEHQGPGAASDQELALLAAHGPRPPSAIGVPWLHKRPCRGRVFSSAWCPQGLRQQASKLASLDVRSHGVAKCLNAALDADWERRHTEVAHNSCDDLGKVSNQSSRCWRDGHCTCQPESALKLGMATGLRQAISQVFSARGKELRQALQQGWFVAAFSSRRSCHLGDRVGAAAPGAAAPPVVEMWCHIACQSLSPIEGAYQLMRPVIGNSSDVFVTLDGLAEFCSELQLMQKLLDAAGDRDAAWNVRYYRLVADEGIAGTFTPARQNAKAMSEPLPFWPGEATWKQTAAFLRRLARDTLGGATLLRPMCPKCPQGLYVEHAQTDITPHSEANSTGSSAPCGRRWWPDCTGRCRSGWRPRQRGRRGP